MPSGQSYSSGCARGITRQVCRAHVSAGAEDGGWVVKVVLEETLCAGHLTVSGGMFAYYMECCEVDSRSGPGLRSLSPSPTRTKTIRSRTSRHGRRSHLDLTGRREGVGVTMERRRYL
jgi:hypothetical protein